MIQVSMAIFKTFPLVMPDAICSCIIPNMIIYLDYVSLRYSKCIIIEPAGSNSPGSTTAQGHCVS